MIETIIREARVYRRSAVIVRKGTLELQKGINRIEVSGIPFRADTESVRLDLPVGTVSSGIRLSEAVKADAGSAALEEKINETERKITAREFQLKAWQDNSVFTDGTATDLAAMEQYLEKLPERLDRTASEIYDLQKQKEELERQRNAARPTGGYILRADIMAQEAGTYPFSVRYRDARAGWNRSYEIYADDLSGPLRILIKGNVFQHTEENWGEVKLSLYTGTPQAGNTLPLFEKMTVRLRKNSRNLFSSVISAKGLARSAVMMDEESVAMADASEVPMWTAETEVQDTMTEYTLPGAWDVPAGEEGIFADLQQITAGAEYRISAVPKYSDSAYLTAEVPAAEFPQITEDEASVYLRGSYTGNVRLSSEANDGKYTISLGRDEQIQIRRNKASEETETAFLKNHKKTSFTYDIEIVSRKSEESELTVIDQIPVSEDKQIDVETAELSGGTLDAENGKVTWNVKVPAYGTVKLRLAYSVAWPKNEYLSYD